MCAYIKALDWDTDHMIGDMACFKNAKDEYIYLFFDVDYIDPPLMDEILDKLNKDKKDLELFVQGKK